MAVKKTDRLDAHIRIVDGAIVIDEIRVNNESLEANELNKLLVLREHINQYFSTYEADPQRRK